MSRFHFSRQFRLAMGVSPHRYAMTKRIERAKQLLRDRSSNVLDVALNCGFKDASHFSRVFKAIVGYLRRASKSLCLARPAIR